MRTIGWLGTMSPEVSGAPVKNRTLKLAIAALLLVAVGVPAGAAVAQDEADVEAKIANAMSAGPLGITAEATVIDMAFDADGKFVVLRPGTNGWFCAVDDP